MKASTIYLIRKRAMGDVLWMEPVIAELAQKYSRVIIHSRFNELFQNYPATNVVFKDQLSFFEKLLVWTESKLGISFFSINLDESYEKFPKQHPLEVYFKKAGLPVNLRYPRLYLKEAEKPKNVEPYVVVHLSAYSAIKNFRNVYGIKWKNIQSYLEQRGYRLIEIGSPPGMIPNKFQKTSIREMITLIKGAKLFIGIDSGPSHIAASLNVPAIIFFGAINPAYRHIKNLFSGIIMQQRCELAGCYHENPNAAENHICPLFGDEGIPKCCTFTDEMLLKNINAILK